MFISYALTDPTGLAALAICDRAAERAARQTGVPVSVLKAVTRVETGRPNKGQVEPWPWTINLAGKGYWFNTSDEAMAFAFRHFKTGARNFDIGCFQINYRWHAQAFSSIEDMFDPERNALYAARFLAELHGEFGEWESAAGAFHSRTRKFADRYKARFRAVHASLGARPGDTAAPISRPSGPGALISSGPGGQRAPGSLVALSARAASAFLPLD